VVLSALQLQPTGQCQMVTPSTGVAPQLADTYDVGILIPHATQSGLVLPIIVVSAAELFLAQGFHALIGRDILQRCVLTYNGSAAIFTLAY
jgi:hypothetical protein